MDASAERMDRRSLARQLGVLLLAAAPLLWFWWLCDGQLFAPAEALGHTFGKNHAMAVEILQTGTTSGAFHPPGYAVIVAAVYGALGPEPGGVRIVQAALLGVPVACAAHVGRALGGRRVAYLAAAATALHPALPRYATYLHADLLCTRICSARQQSLHTDNVCMPTSLARRPALHAGQLAPRLKPHLASPLTSPLATPPCVACSSCC